MIWFSLVPHLLRFTREPHPTQDEEMVEVEEEEEEAGALRRHTNAATAAATRATVAAAALHARVADRSFSRAR